MKNLIIVLCLASCFTGFGRLGAVLAHAQPAAEENAGLGGGVFPNDSGPTDIDVSSYPKELQKTYGVFKVKCAACHTIARPINSQFLEITKQEKDGLLAKDPDLLKDPSILVDDEHLWSRYVKRMMQKPGCPVGRDGQRIWEFLVYDSKVRKTGANAKAWREHRAKLLADFKQKDPRRYQELFGAKEK